MPSRRRDVLRVKWNPKTQRNELVLLEEHVLEEITDRLWLQAKIRVFRVNCPVGGKVRPNVPGIPDLMGWIPNVQRTGWTLPLFIEVKRPKGVRRAAQERFIAQALADGCVAFFAESWADVVKELCRFGIRLPV